MDPCLTVVAVVGPTATGKSELALRIAEALGGEVVNADSMQLYRGMDVGTAKLDRGRAARRPAPPARRLGRDRAPPRRRVPARWPGPSIDDVLAPRPRSRSLVGGTGLYVRAALDELEFPGTDPALRARLEAELADVGPEALHARLQAARPRCGAAASCRRTAAASYARWRSSS